MTVRTLQEDDGAERIPMDSRWREVFNRYDVNNDGQISYCELRTAIRTDRNTFDIPRETIRRLWMKADEDGNGYLSYEEFVTMIQNPENHSVFGHLNKYMNNYISLARPKRRAPAAQDRRSVDPTSTEWDYQGEYEDQYSCWPPALGMILISLVEIGLFAYDAAHGETMALGEVAQQLIYNPYRPVAIGLFAYDAAHGETMALGEVAQQLIYNPYRRYEAWRFVTYMFVHVGYTHLIVNLIVQIGLGIPLEMVHRCWRVGVVYLAGVLAGSLGTSITSPKVYLAGASGGVYALIAAHLATIIMNWKEMKYAIYQLLFFTVLCSFDVGTAIYNNYYLQLDDKVGYSAHLFGALAGLLVAILVLRNLEVLKWERVLWWASLAVYVGLMLAAIIWNAAATDYFRKPRY